MLRNVKWKIVSCDILTEIFRTLVNCSANEPESFLPRSHRGQFAALHFFAHNFGYTPDMDYLLKLTDEQISELNMGDIWNRDDTIEILEKYSVEEILRLTHFRSFYFTYLFIGYPKYKKKLDELGARLMVSCH